MQVTATLRGGLLSQAPCKPRSSTPAPNTWRPQKGRLGQAYLGPLPNQAAQQDPDRIRLQALPGMGNIPEQLTGDLPVDSSAVRLDLSRWLSLAAYAALHLAGFPSHFLPTPDGLFSALAWYQLAWSALSLLTSRFEFDRVGAVIAPAFLATRALPALASRVSAFGTASALFGYYLAKDLPGPIYVWLPTLAYAIYSGYSPQWAVAVFGLTALWKLADMVRSGGRPPLQHLAFAGLAAWGLYAGQAPLLAVVIFGGQLVASAVT